MPASDIGVLKKAIQSHWLNEPSSKAQRYVGQFFDQQRIGTKITAKVLGNHGTYTVSIQIDEQQLSSACSCYIGKHGYCHHCEALAKTFLDDVSVFKEVKLKKWEDVERLAELHDYLQGVTLESLVAELKANGISQKAFAESIGMGSRHLSAIKSSEKRNRYYHELGATKLACLWVLEQFRGKKP